MKITYGLAALALAYAMPLPAVAAPIQAVMYKNPTCTCCETYAAYLEENGFQVKLIPSNDLAQISTSMGVPENLQGCHTITVESYLVVGFVPVDQVRKMLNEGSAITGLSLPGMPMGSAGMPGKKTEVFKIYSFLTHGESKIYATE